MKCGLKGILSGIALLLVLAGYSPRGSITALAAEPAAAGSLVRVEVVHPQRTAIRQSIEQPAQLRAFEETPLSAKVAGYVQRMNVDLGDRVKGPQFDAQGQETAPGQILAQLWIPEAEDEVRQKQAAVAQANANAQQARAAIGVAQAAIVSAQATALQAAAGVKRAEAQFQRWHSEMDRFVQLAAQSAVTQKLVDETRQQRDAADADRQEAAAKREAAEALIAESRAHLEKARADLVAAEANVHAAQADAQRAATLLAYGAIRAPYDGTIMRRNVDTGRLVQPGPQNEPLLVVVRTDVLRLQIDLPENDAAVVQAGAPVTVRLPALPTVNLEAKLVRLAGSLDAASRTLRVEADIPNPQGSLRPGMYAQATILVAEHRQALVLPVSAIVADKAESWCQAVVAGKVVRRLLVLGLRSKAEVEVVSGLGDHEAVIRTNPTAFSEGQEVEAVDYVAPKP